MEKAVRAIRSGELVAMPTETVYGLAANAYDVDAVLKVFTVKDRPSFDPLIVHIGNKEDLRLVATHLPRSAEALIQAFWPGPLTLILPKRDQIPDIVTSGSERVAVRMPAHPMALELLRRSGTPLAAPSANPFGYVSPTTAQHVADQLGERIAYILDGGPCTVGVESTIIGWEQIDGRDRWSIHRFGGVPIEAIEKVTGPLFRAIQSSRPIAPGMLTSHYAPRTPLVVGDIDELIALHHGKRIATISFTKRYPVHLSEVLSPGNDLHEAARNLFSALRRSDTGDVQVILAERFPEEGLGRAMNDRLLRASAAR